MKVLFINMNRNKSPMPVVPLGACLVTEATERAGHNVRFVDLMFEKYPVKAIGQAVERFRPDVVGLSVRNIDNNDMLNPVFFPKDILPLINKIRELTSAPIVLGGAAVSVMPEQLLRYFGADWAVLGEGEQVFPDFLRKLSGSQSADKIPGLARIEEGVFHSSSPAQGSCTCEGAVPDFARWIDLQSYIKNMATAPLQTKLGCHFQCVYCTYRKIEGNSYRLFDPESTAEAVRKYTGMGFRNVEFVDNVFNSPYKHCLSVCEELARIKHHARLQTYELNPLFVDDDLILAMKRAGFVGVGITVESVSSKVLARLRKGYSADSVYGAAEIIRRHRLPCIWIFMLGGPGENEETVQETIHFAESAIRPNDTAFFTTGIRIYPGTELERIAREQGMLTKPADEMLEPFFYVSPEVDPGWLVDRVRSAMRKNMNFINGDTFDLPYLPAINRLSSQVGIQPPLWRYARFIRRGLRLIGAHA